VAGPEAVTGLIGLLEPETAKGAGSSVFARAMAATALGRIASRGGPRALDRLSADFLWRVTTPVLTEVLSLP
jgi:hypothetical protein